MNPIILFTSSNTLSMPAQVIEQRLDSIELALRGRPFRYTFSANSYAL